MIKPNRDTNFLHPTVKYMWFELVDKCAEQNIYPKPSETWRSPERQLELWQLGRNAKGQIVDHKKVVTYIKVPTMHGKGLAIDFYVDDKVNIYNPVKIKKVLEIANKLGFSDLRPMESCHIEWRGKL